MNREFLRIYTIFIFSLGTSISSLIQHLSGFTSIRCILCDLLFSSKYPNFISSKAFADLGSLSFSKINSNSKFFTLLELIVVV